MTPVPHSFTETGFYEGYVVAERYELANVLGSGPGTVVFCARDFLSSSRIAVKLFRASALQSPAASKTFKRELNVLREGSHRNVVRIFDFGEVSGTFYIAMELVDGQPLSRQIADGSRWSFGEVANLLEQLADALAWLHSRGLVHGDIRASNLVWDKGALTVMDFGIERDLRQVTLHTPDSTCPYASPERLLGLPLTPASDLYSAAAVAYHLLTGEPPHSRATLLERTVAEAPRLTARTNQPPPKDLEDILERCLHPDAAARPASAMELFETCRQLRTQSDVHRSGPVLADFIPEHPADVKEICALALGMCRSLREIHDAGLAHPELAPANLRVAPGFQVQIPTYPAPPANATLIINEPKYAAPELLFTYTTVDGGAHEQSDIYGLGFVLYEALAGRNGVRKQLFEDLDQPESDLFWLKWHADVSARLQPLHEVNPLVPQELSTLVQSMIEKDPPARLRTLKEVEWRFEQVERKFQTTADIEVASLSAPSPAPAPATPQTKPHRRRSRHRDTILILLLAACGAGWWIWRSGTLPAGASQSVRWAMQKAASVRATVSGLLPRRPSPPATLSESALPPAIETKGGPMVLVPAGTFVMGSSAVANEAPAHTVQLPAFYIDKYEVSNGRFRAFTEENATSQPMAPSWDPDYFAKSTYPVLNVSWREAAAFCVAIGKRLPTEAEWEKAARGSSPGSRAWANWTVGGLANLKRDGPAQPAAIGSFPGDVSPFGAYDMAGNVHEWVSDDYRLYVGNPATLDETGAWKVVRGGSFALAPSELSPSWRASLDPIVHLGQDSPVGFRCAADPPRPAQR